MIIHSHFKDYSVEFIDRPDEISAYFQENNTYFVIDRNIDHFYPSLFADAPKDRIYIIDAIESKKTVETALDICEAMTGMASKRNTHLISVGGGITQDITGFVANVLYRGINWTFYPTTLLAACDSCIGGKTSLNYKGFKNLLGTFFPPDNIRIWPEFFRTLTEKDYHSGLGEVVKFNVMAGADGIDHIETEIGSLLARKPHTIERFVRNSLEFKKTFIEEDEFDKGKRILLNFAHTFGHAFEVSSNYEIPHGSAVALGMIVANRISVRRGLLAAEFAGRIEKVCRQILPDNLQKNWFDFQVIMSAIRKDKKQTSNTIKAVLMREDLSLHVFDDLTAEEIQSGLDYLMKEFISF